jgi:(p)ppGpp synthase/HD superfamily hydrolase
MKAHSGQTRKAGGSPYVLHPMEAAVIAATLTRDEDVIAAALLHDVVEDAGVGIEEIREKFGSRVADLVSSETENKRHGTPPEQTWQVRKEETLKTLKETDDEGVKIIWLSDKLSNIRSMHAGVRREGDAFFNAFHQKDKKMHEWYYREVASALESLKDSDAYGEYMFLLDEIFNDKSTEDK